MTTPLLLAMLAGAFSGVPSGVPEQVAVRVLSRHHPRTLQVSGGGRTLSVATTLNGLKVDGVAVAGPVALPAGRWRLTVPGGAARDYVGSVSLAAEGSEVAVIVRMSLEDHVARVVAAESEPDTPQEALRALAVVARSFASASHGRHGEADLCDLAHCQVMGGLPRGNHGAAARVAARATAGKVLLLPSGSVAAAPFHAACGGHTADPLQVWGGGGTGAAAVADPGCPAFPWRSAVAPALVSRIAGRELSRGTGAAPPVPVEDLRFVRGAGGHVVQVSDGHGSIRGESFARALDRALGHGRIRSTRFDVHREGALLDFVGSGVGHGVGLCQVGAARLAGEGKDHAGILEHYFPFARLGSPLAVTSLRAGQPAPRSAPLNRTSSR